MPSPPLRSEVVIFKKFETIEKVDKLCDIVDKVG